MAALHDVAEDTAVTLDDLRRADFGDEIMAALTLLTRDKGAPYDDYIERIAASTPLVRAVKLADLEDNMDVRQLPEVTAEDRERLARYRKARGRLREA